MRGLFFFKAGGSFGGIYCTRLIINSLKCKFAQSHKETKLSMNKTFGALIKNGKIMCYIKRNSIQIQTN